MEFLKRRLATVEDFLKTTLKLLFTPWKFVVPTSDGEDASVFPAGRYVFSAIALFVIVWQLPAFFRDSADRGIILRLLGAIFLAENIVVFFAALVPLMIWYRTGWRFPLACAFYAIGAVTCIDTVWAGSKMLLAAYPNEFTTPYLGSCKVLGGYGCREDIVLRRLQSVSSFVVAVETVWCALILFALLSRKWAVPAPLTAVGVGVGAAVITFFGAYLAQPILWLHRLVK